MDEVYPGVIDITGLFVHETVADIAAYIDSRLAPEEEAPLEQIEQDVETLVGQFVSGALSEDDIAKIKKHVINPVECREASLEKPETLKMSVTLPQTVETLTGFNEMDRAGLERFVRERGLIQTQEEALL